MPAQLFGAQRVIDRLDSFSSSPARSGRAPFLMPKSPWSQTELVWLADKSPGWHEARLGKHVSDWVTTTTNGFLTSFPHWKEVEYKKMHTVSIRFPPARRAANSHSTEYPILVLSSCQASDRYIPHPRAHQPHSQEGLAKARPPHPIPSVLYVVLPERHLPPCRPPF